MFNNIKSSFRDPSGYVFKHDDKFFRFVSMSYKSNYDLLMSSGLYQNLLKGKLIIGHEECSADFFSDNLLRDGYKILKPEIVPFISYPYEWCFGQMKDAAITTLTIQLESLKYGMTLKDASAYNIQFIGARAVFIDTLSFEKYEEGRAWVAYRQFCKHFLAPLALMAYRDHRMHTMLKEYIDGIPLDLASELLPLKTKFMPGIYMHLHLHAKIQDKFENKGKTSSKETFLKKQNLINLIENLLSVIQKMNLKNASTEWGEYYTFTNYSDDAFTHKQALVKLFIEKTTPAVIWDMGANNGLFSKIASLYGYTIAFDLDCNAVESCYQAEKNTDTRVLPLIMDLTNPSPSIGWANIERESLVARSNANTVMALALIHHIAISHNVPFSYIADFFAQLGQYLIIEWVPKDDSQTQKILDGRKDIFDKYDVDTFENSFKERFNIIEKENIKNTKRVLYLMARKLI